MNGFNIFKAGVFITRGNWSDADDFADFFKKRFSKIGFDKNLVIKEIDRTIAELKVESEIGQMEALRILLSEDIEKIKENIEKINFKDTETELKESFEKFKKILQKEGIKYNKPLFIVDNFPKPYDFFDRIGVRGTNFDKADNKMFGLKVGIYLKKQTLSPITSTFLLSHEFVHNVVGLTDCNQLARGLEEGFTQFFGEVYLCSELFGFEFVRNYQINNRLFYPFTGQRWELYYDWLRQGCVFYQKFGLDGMIEVIKKGRITERKIDELILEGKLSELKLKSGRWTKELDQIAELILSFNRNMVYSPLAAYMSRFIKKGQRADKLIEDFNF